MAITNRNLKFYGFAYGDTPVTLDVKINGQQVFLNTVSTIPGPVPLSGDILCDQTLFEVADTDLFPTTFSGAYTHSVEVSGGNGILMGSVVSNYMPTYTGNIVTPGNATTFKPLYDGRPPNSDGTPDVRSSVQIDGEVPSTGNVITQGTWTWQVDTGSIFSCNLNVGIGNVAA